MGLFTRERHSEEPGGIRVSYDTFEIKVKSFLTCTLIIKTMQYFKVKSESIKTLLSCIILKVCAKSLKIIVFYPPYYMCTMFFISITIL